MIWPLWSHISTSGPVPPALPWMPSPEFLLFLSQLPLLGCSLLLCKENLPSAFRYQLFHEGSPDLLKANHFLICVSKHFIRTFPLHYSAFTTLYGNYLTFCSHPEASGSFCFVFKPSCVCLLIWLQEPSQQVFGESTCHPALGHWSEYSFSAYTNTAGYLKTRQDRL